MVLNGFMVFTIDWKTKYGGNISLPAATTEAGKIWANMTAQERGPYNARAKQDKGTGNVRVEKLSCIGTPLTVVENDKIALEKREQKMKQCIEQTVRNSVETCELELQSYYFIMVNYFAKTLKSGVYVPAEISLAEYSFKDGVCRKYHSFINPGVTIYGHQYEAQHHSDTTHKLPLPPNAMGEKNLGRIYNDLLNFIRDKETGEYPPLYTNRESMPIVESVLDFLKADVAANNINLSVYSIQYLFYMLKLSTCAVAEVEKPKSVYITDAYFERDFFEYQTGIACVYHEEIDKSNYCTQSCVTRWGFMFSDYMCRDLSIYLVPGCHVPKSTNIAAIIKPESSSYINDTESFISLATDTSYATKAVSEHGIYYDDQRANFSEEQLANKFSALDFPSLNKSAYGAKRIAAAAAKANSTTPIPAQKSNAPMNSKKQLQSSYDDDTLDLNPWASRSMHVPRKPDTSQFQIGSLGEEYASDCDDFNSVASFGRGRGMLNRSLNTSVASGSTSGRGRLYQL